MNECKIYDWKEMDLSIVLYRLVNIKKLKRICTNFFSKIFKKKIHHEDFWEYSLTLDRS